MSIEDLHDAMRKMEGLRKDSKLYIKLNPIADAHIRWLIKNNHLHPENVSIDGVIEADKKLGITPFDWKAFS